MYTPTNDHDDGKQSERGAPIEGADRGSPDP